jgi:hypothetical protein
MLGTATLVDLDNFYINQNTFVNLSRELYYRAKMSIKSNIINNAFKTQLKNTSL